MCYIFQIEEYLFIVYSIKNQVAIFVCKFASMIRSYLDEN